MYIYLNRPQLSPNKAYIRYFKPNQKAPEYKQGLSLTYIDKAIFYMDLKTTMFRKDIISKEPKLKFRLHE